MGNLADYIEQYIKKLLEQRTGNEIEIQRRELAEKFQCVPSQINYVLSTRFNIKRGYIVESRRGGGGYIRIFRLNLTASEIGKIILKKSQDGCSSKEMADILQRMIGTGIVSKKEGILIQKGIEHEIEDVNPSLQDLMRGKFLKVVLMILLRNK